MTGERRSGVRPLTSDEGAHRQVDQLAPAALWGELVDRVFGLDGVVEGHSQDLVLPPARGAELVGLGWAEPHQYSDFGTELMVYGPRDPHEVDEVVSIVEESLAFARGSASAGMPFLI